MREEARHKSSFGVYELTKNDSELLKRIYQKAQKMNFTVDTIAKCLQDCYQVLAFRSGF